MSVRISLIQLKYKYFNCRELWEFEPILDGEEDLARRHKRAAEFESRFSRNYLYNLSRQMGEIHKLMKNYSPRFIEKNSSQTIFQKISNAHTLIFQGLSAYQKHLASSIPGGVPEKLNDLLAHACDLWRVCNKCEILKPILYSPGRNEVYIEDIDEKCKKLLQNIRSDQENKMKLEQKPSCTSTITVTPKKSPKKIDKKNRLSMYTLETPYILKHQRAFWKKSLNHLSKPKHIRPKKKPNSPEDKSKNKMELTVNYLNPSMSQESFPMKHKKSEIICEPPKEDEIITQMDILNQRESGVNNSIEPEKKSEGNVGSEMSKEQFNESLRPLLLEILQNIDNKENLEDEKNSMMELKNVLTEIKQVTVKDHNHSDTDITPKLSLQKKRSKTTITGPKNAKLICLSPVESENDEDVNSIVSTPPPCQTVATSTSDVEIQKECIDSPTQTSSLNATRNVNSMLKKPSPRTNFVSPRNDVITKTVKFQKPRPKIMKINMPKSIIRNLTKYKDLYANHTRKNSMYVIKKNRKPWEILSKIADTLLDSMISDVVSELEIDNLLLKLYEMEFH
ncbi:uncharacterized protein LOC123292638 [Chrysoperla carnea]|uniref:uncharacterized protein LOC123292638 n=1 Tax=Chrysoperla carnea TaxID=189513 RepID=UPI001D06E9B9|nr:uncharacterized protein LOC123292638 [Chrysoperla carnea]